MRRSVVRTYRSLGLALILLSLALALPAGASAGTRETFGFQAASSSGLGTLVVDSRPACADVRLDGIDAGLSTPATFTGLTAGEHHLSITIPGFQAWEETVTVASDATTNVAAALLVALPAMPFTEITVTSTSDAIDGDVSGITALQADPGADGISLREAITAANATAGTKIIRFAAGLHDAVITPGLLTGQPLPTLTSGRIWIIGDSDGDGAPDITLDGRLGLATPCPLSNGISIWSSGNVISGLRLVNYGVDGGAISFAPPSDWAGPSKTLADDYLLGNSIAGGSGIGVVGNEDPAPASDLIWSGLIFAGNEVAGTIGLCASGTAHDDHVIDLTIASNLVTGGFGISLVAGDANTLWHGMPGPIRYADHNTAQGVTIEHNRCVGSTYKGIEIRAGNMGNSDCAVSNVAIRDNDISLAGDVGSIGVVLDAGDVAFTAGERATARDSLSHIEVRGNRIRGAGRGITVYASENWWNQAASPLAGGAIDNVAADIVIADNQIQDSGDCGIVAAAGNAEAGLSPCANTTLSALVISGNLIANATTGGTGIRLAAGISSVAGAPVMGNVVTGAVITNNTVRGFDQGIWISGGNGTGAVGNTLTGSSSGNSVTAIEPWRVAADSAGASANTLAFQADELTPQVTSFTPASGPAGTLVTIVGTGFAWATAVTFNGTPAIFSVVSAALITATVPASAGTGTIVVTASGGTATSAASFTVAPTATPAPTPAPTPTPTPAPTPTPLPTPTVTLKLSGLKSGVIKLGTSVIARGSVNLTSLAGSRVTLKVQLKKSGKWVKAKTFSALITSTGVYSWKYKPAKKGAYRIQTSVAKTATHAAVTTKWLAFKVK